MSSRSHALAERLEAGARKLAAFAGGPVDSVNAKQPAGGRVSRLGLVRRLACLVLPAAIAVACGADPAGPGPEPGPPIPDGLWTVSGSPPSIVRLAPEQLFGTGDRTPATEITTPDLGLSTLAGVAFGPDGRLWITSADNGLLLAFTPESLAGSGPRAATVTIASFRGSLDLPLGLAFDQAHRLWVANSGNGTLARFDPADLAVSGAPAPAVVVSGVGQPRALAFDAAGSLWVADNGAHRVVRYDAAQLAVSGSQVPAVTLTSSDASLLNPSGLAFDAGGTLWVSNLGGPSVVAFGPAQLAAGGTTKPEVVLTSTGGSLSLPTGLAFDADGSLWVGGATGVLTQVRPATLIASGSPAPTARLTIAGHSIFWSAAFRTNPAGLPLH
ncbi:MAG TPA: NHL repeat-containing protein [Gemmatimonadales bacterium]|nr:NHL repeat-containing protein [Gemmatimonadales bacterium]